MNPREGNTSHRENGRTRHYRLCILSQEEDTEEGNGQGLLQSDTQQVSGWSSKHICYAQEITMTNEPLQAPL